MTAPTVSSFKARFLRTSAPTSADGIEKYLSSGMIRGVGPVYAKKLVVPSAKKCSTLLRLRRIGCERSTASAGSRCQHSRRLGRTEGGRKSWSSCQPWRRHGAGGTDFQDLRSRRHPGHDREPYRLARDIRGIGFKTADAIAMKLGIEKTAIVRVRAGIFLRADRSHG